MSRQGTVSLVGTKEPYSTRNLGSPDVSAKPTSVPRAPVRPPCSPRPARGIRLPRGLTGRI
jgi:hypothetical protein